MQKVIQTGLSDLIKSQKCINKSGNESTQYVIVDDKSGKFDISGFIKHITLEAEPIRNIKIPIDGINSTLWKNKVEFQVGTISKGKTIKEFVSSPSKDELMGLLVDYENKGLDEIVSSSNIMNTIVNTRDIPIHCGNVQDYMVKEVPRYVPTNGEMEIYKAHLDSCIPLLLKGPKGIAKTLSIAHFAKINGTPLLQFDCSENTRRSDLIGRFLVKGQDIVFELGIIPVAMKITNEYGTGILSFEEISALTPGMQKVLNQLLDWRGHVYIPEIGKLFKPDTGKKLLVVATMNPSTYGGTYELNEDLLSRFSILTSEYPTQEQERKIIDWVDIPDFIRDGILTFATETRNAVLANVLDYALSPRDVDMFCKAYRSYHKHGLDAKSIALKTTVINKYETKEHLTYIKTRLDRIFRVDSDNTDNEIDQND